MNDTLGKVEELKHMKLQKKTIHILNSDSVNPYHWNMPQKTVTTWGSMEQNQSISRQKKAEWTCNLKPIM